MIRHPATLCAALGALLLTTACKGESKPTPAPQAPAAETAYSAKPAADTAAEPAPPAAETATGAATPASEPLAAAPAPSSAPDHAERPYQGGLDQLDTCVDLSKLVLEQPAAAEATAPDAAQPSSAAAPVALDTPGPNPLDSLNRSLEAKGGMSLLEGESPVADFGVVRQGESREHVFRFKSDGEEPLEVRALKPSCGCTKAEIQLLSETGEVLPYEKGAPIPVGQQFQLLTEASTDGKGPGAFGTQVSIYTNAPDSPVNVKLAATIEPVLVVEPEHQVMLGQLTTVEQKEADLTVYSKRGERFLLQIDPALQAVKRAVEAKLVPENPDAEGKSDRWKVHIVAGPGLDIGMVNAPVQLVSDIPILKPKYPNADGTPKTFPVMIAVQARVVGLVNAEPGFLSFGMVRPGQTLERVVRIECRDDFQLPAEMPTTIAGLYGGEFPYAANFATEFVPVEPGKSVDLKLKLLGLPEDLSGSFGGILKVSVGHPSMAEVSVRFSGVCRPGAPLAPAAAPSGGGTGN
jgi:hypothetical protein